MDITPHHTSQNESSTSADPCFGGPRGGLGGDSVHGAPNGENHCRMICMPSSRAIADAIIRRTLAEVRA